MTQAQTQDFSGIYCRKGYSINKTTNTQRDNSRKNAIVSAGVGCVTGHAVNYATARMNRLLVVPEFFTSIHQMNNHIKLADTMRAGDQMLKHYGLDKKGVTYVFTKENIINEKVVSVFKESLDNCNVFTDVIAKTLKLIGFNSPVWTRHDLRKEVDDITNGHSALYLPLKKITFVPEKMSGSLLHEIGHAVNFSRIKAFSVPAQLIFHIGVPVVFMTSLFSTPQKNKTDNTVIDKVRCFIKSNSGVLAFACYLPILGEEAIASVRAINFAKKARIDNKNILDPSQIKALSRTFKLAFSTYVVAAVGIGVAVQCASLVKDKVFVVLQQRSRIQGRSEKQIARKVT